MKNNGMTEEDFALLERIAEEYWAEEEQFKMTDREKEIEELARAIFSSGVAIDGTDFAYGLSDKNSHFHRMAAKLIDAGYRREDDVQRETARQVYGKICAIIAEASTDGEFIDGDGYDYLAAGLREIAKEYGVEELV